MTVDDLGALLDRVAGSVGPPVYERPQDLPVPPPPRESWIDLQHAVVAAAAEEEDPALRRRAAAVLLQAVLDQPVFGPSNRLAAESFALILDELPDELDRSLSPGVGAVLAGGRRYLTEHVWTIPGDRGAQWLRRLCERDPLQVGALIQDMRFGSVPRWRDADFAARIDVLAALPPDPRPPALAYVGRLEPPEAALPALNRLVLAHGTSATDVLVRTGAERLRAARSGDPDTDIARFDWAALAHRPELGVWLLELAGPAGYRDALVRAAGSAGVLDGAAVEQLARELHRPAWADGDVPWQVREVVAAGTVRLPDGRLSGGDPWWTGGYEGIPFTLDVSPGEHPAEVVVAHHPLAPPGCAALRLALAPGEPVRWDVVEVPLFGEVEGYVVEAGAASLGSPALYEAALVHESAEAQGLVGESAAWLILDGGDLGTVAICTVVSQHQTCVTWTGHDDAGRIVAVVTDLGLLEPDPAALWAAGR